MANLPDDGTFMSPAPQLKFFHEVTAMSSGSKFFFLLFFYENDRKVNELLWLTGNTGRPSRSPSIHAQLLASLLRSCSGRHCAQTTPSYWSCSPHALKVFPTHILKWHLVNILEVMDVLNVIVTVFILMTLNMSMFFLCYCSITHIVKQYGQHLKASTAMVRLRLYEVLALLPPQSFESEYYLLNVMKLLYMVT